MQIVKKSPTKLDALTKASMEKNLNGMVERKGDGNIFTCVLARNFVSAPQSEFKSMKIGNEDYLVDFNEKQHYQQPLASVNNRNSPDLKRFVAKDHRLTFKCEILDNNKLRLNVINSGKTFLRTKKQIEIRDVPEKLMSAFKNKVGHDALEPEFVDMIQNVLMQVKEDISVAQLLEQQKKAQK
jgi:hypothetical protein